jgi:hypothetical protein
MPVDRKYPDILHCAKCHRPWKKHAGPLPKRCAYRDCKSRDWFDGIDRRERMNLNVPEIGTAMMSRATQSLRNKLEPLMDAR